MTYVRLPGTRDIQGKKIINILSIDYTVDSSLTDYTRKQIKNMLPKSEKIDMRRKK